MISFTVSSSVKKLIAAISRRTDTISSRPALVRVVNGSVAVSAQQIAVSSSYVANLAIPLVWPPLATFARVFVTTRCSVFYNKTGATLLRPLLEVYSSMTVGDFNPNVFLNQNDILTVHVAAGISTPVGPSTQLIAFTTKSVTPNLEVNSIYSLTNGGPEFSSFSVTPGLDYIIEYMSGKIPY